MVIINTHYLVIKKSYTHNDKVIVSLVASQRVAKNYFIIRIKTRQLQLRGLQFQAFGSFIILRSGVIRSTLL